jgi:hypothetical protein
MLVRIAVSVWDSLKELIMGIQGKIGFSGGTPLLWMA